MRHLMVYAAMAIFIVLTSKASALTVDVPVTPDYLMAHPHAFSIKAEKRDDGLVHFTVTRHLSEPRYLVGHLKVLEKGVVLMEGHFPAFVREKAATYYLVVSPQHLSGARFDLGEYFFNVDDQTPAPRPGGANYQIQLADFAPAGDKPEAEEQAGAAIPSPEASWHKSTGRDDYRRVLALRCNDFSGAYAIDQPIPVSIEVRNLGPQVKDGAHPLAQLFPHLDVWVDFEGQRSHLGFALEIENRLWIEVGKDFEMVFDLRKAIDLSKPGVYRVSVGHENHAISDLGDWTGTLRSSFQTITIGEGGTTPKHLIEESGKGIEAPAPPNSP